MNLTRPNVSNWWIALILGVLALLGLGTIAALFPYAFWLGIAGLALITAIAFILLTALAGLRRL